jgi:hypothetical protein
MVRSHKDELNETKRLMAALGRMPPKPHEDMKLGKTTAKKKTRLKRSSARNPSSPR